ncbi:MAG TPA: tyrosine--tRNA ligase [bacterium]|nr:tyrosine--tRNA ligase [bacterium]
MEQSISNRGIEEIIDKKSLLSRLNTGKKLRIKLGVDPTRPDIHLGHAVTLRKLREFQDLGHTVIFLIGDFTTKIGDPSGKSKTRPMLSDEEIASNAKTYFDQVGKVLDLKKTEVRYNSEWFSKMKFDDILRLVAQFTAAQILERDDFEKRLKNGSDIGIHELLYPIMQAYDSIALEADVEMGGTDQKFNMLAGRDLQRKMGKTPQEVITMRLLAGLDGKEKMSKSLDNYIGISEAPEIQFGKVMSLPDEMILPYFELCTDLSEEEIAQIALRLKQENPRDLKMELAYKIVAIYNNVADANKAKDRFIAVFSKREIPTDIPAIEIKHGKYDPVSLLVELKALESRSEARRLIEQGGIRIDSEKIDSIAKEVSIKSGTIIQVGKLKYFKIK